jgi:hypothetical protein
MAMLRSHLAGCVLVTLAAAAIPAAAQQGVQLTEQAITEACRDLHGVSNVQSGKLEIGPGGDLVLNCRLVNVSGFTLAQVSFEQACRKMTGSHEWYRGMGAQVFCRGASAQANPAPAVSASPSGGELITQDDIARACRQTHRNPQAVSEPTTMGRYGIELNCRLINSNGFTMARVSPEEVCRAKTGRPEFRRGEGNEIFCLSQPLAIEGYC